MIILERDGSLSWHTKDSSSEDIQESVEIPAELVTHPNNVIDHVLNLVFDTLGLQAVELRIREEEEV